MAAQKKYKTDRRHNTPTPGGRLRESTQKKQGEIQRGGTNMQLPPLFLFSVFVFV